MSRKTNALGTLLFLFSFCSSYGLEIDGRLPTWLGERRTQFSRKLSNREAERINKMSAEMVLQSEFHSDDESEVSPSKNYQDLGANDPAELAPSDFDLDVFEAEKSSVPLRATYLCLSKGDAKGMSALARLVHNMDMVFGGFEMYPLIIFHEGIDEPKQRALQSKTKRRLIFAAVVLQLPKMELPSSRWPYPGFSYFGVQYRQMCRFFAVEMFRQPVLQDFDWYMRLDTDSFILAPVAEDPFLHMARNNKQYAFTQLFMQGQLIFIQGLWDTVRACPQVLASSSKGCGTRPRHPRAGTRCQPLPSSPAAAFIRVVDTAPPSSHGAFIQGLWTRPSVFIQGLWDTVCACPPVLASSSNGCGARVRMPSSPGVFIQGLWDTVCACPPVMASSSIGIV
ncbi:hypothetical protein CYMTET_43520 [Cymbomonas tetramitiformis]|uniref:Hexosyltransferase n=1 Tax=Cymbomonas tetramitiformis TaxID=36881 RepID=A0AAE0C3A2_9CHLO|nr:hypothetical protein CYMTET_43520 [Cymbomonas tetramitiformis]